MFYLFFQDKRQQSAEFHIKYADLATASYSAAQWVHTSARLKRVGPRHSIRYGPDPKKGRTLALGRLPSFYLRYVKIITLLQISLLLD